VGITTINVAGLTFIIGSLVYWQQMKLATALTITMLILLASKDAIHNWSRQLTRQDIYSALQFAAVTGVVLPLVPNRYFGPFDAFNPFSIWLMVVLICGLSFIGYLAMRIVGTAAGIGATGFVGGLASSTATTLAFSRQSKDQADLGQQFSWAIVLACTVMLYRLGAIVLMLNLALFMKVIPLLIFMSLPGIFFSVLGLIKFRKNKDFSEQPQIANPLGLGIALQFATIYAVIVFFAKIATHWGGQQGIYILSFLSGIATTDAIVLSLVEMTKQSDLSLVS
jgi:uncharacterized membrane protein (DUF4010 family)